MSLSSTLVQEIVGCCPTFPVRVTSVGRSGIRTPGSIRPDNAFVNFNKPIPCLFRSQPVKLRYAVCFNICRTSKLINDGLLDHNIAAPPATIGVENDVPIQLP